MNERCELAIFLMCLTVAVINIDFLAIRCRAPESLDGALRKLDSNFNKYNLNYTDA